MGSVFLLQRIMISCDEKVISMFFRNNLAIKVCCGSQLVNAPDEEKKEAARVDVVAVSS